MSEILDILEKPIVDENIIKKEYHSYSPYLNAFDHNDEIRIPIQHQDLIVLPSESYILIEGFIEKEAAVTIDKIKFKNNGIAYLFDEIRYELNGFEIDRTRNLGISTLMKNYISLNSNESEALQNAGWSPKNTYGIKQNGFHFNLPLKMLLGFAEDYNKVIMNAKHELILLRSKSDDYVFKIEEVGKEAKIKLTKICWRIPHVQLADNIKLNLLSLYKSRRSIPIAFRSWDAHMNPALASTTDQIWNVKLSLQNERPRQILLAFQSNTLKKETNTLQNFSLTDVKVYLNSESYPYEDLNQNFDQDKYALFYEMYKRFQKSYYMRDPQPLLNWTEYKSKAPIIVIDVSHQNETVKTGPIDIKIQLKTSKSLPANVTAYCLLLHDRQIEYIPMSSEIRKIV